MHLNRDSKLSQETKNASDGTGSWQPRPSWKNKRLHLIIAKRPGTLIYPSAIHPSMQLQRGDAHLATRTAEARFAIAWLQAARCLQITLLWHFVRLGNAVTKQIDQIGFLWGDPSQKTLQGGSIPKTSAAFRPGPASKCIWTMTKIKPWKPNIEWQIAKFLFHGAPCRQTKKPEPECRQ